MNTLDIKSLDEVILFEMQRNKKNTLDFNEICKVCKSAFAWLPVNKPLAFKEEPFNNKYFFHDLLGSIENLENAGIANVVRRDKKILKITLTERGRFDLQNTVFINQERMGDQY